MIYSQEATGPAKPGLDLVRNENRTVLAAQVLDPNEIIVVRNIHSFPLNWFDNKGGDLASAEQFLKRSEIVERHLLAVRQQRPEAIAEILIAIQRQCANRQAVKGVS